MARLAFLGDVMLGRSVGEVLERDGPDVLFSPELVSVLRDVDAVVANLECCISARGARWPDPQKPFFFRAPPIAVDALLRLGVTAVTLANNHALDYGYDALVDTLMLLHAAGIVTTGAGPDRDRARTSASLLVDGISVSLVGCTDHPADYAATPARPGVAYARLNGDPDPWISETIRAAQADCVVVTPHWGPNMVGAPIARVRRAARGLVGTGATLVAGHSAHVFHGIAGPVLFDLGDFVDDYATHPELRNDLGLVFLVELDQAGARTVEAVPIALDFCHTRLATAEEAEWIAARFTTACRALGTEVGTRQGRLVVDVRGGNAAPGAPIV